MTTPTLLELEKELHALGPTLEPSTTLCIDIIKEVCERSALRRPDLVLRCGQALLFGSRKKEALSRLGNSVWDFYEYLLRAALDLNHNVLAGKCLEILQNKFGDTLRVKKLEALALEGAGEFEQALAIYDDLIEMHPTDAICYKRKVAIYKSQNLLAESVQALNKYLQIYQNDLEAYEELADIYLTLGDYKSALFCIEEMILSSPENYIFHLKYADILYTIGDFRNARKYYSQSLNINSENNTRALFGLYLTCKALGSGEKLNRELSALTKQKLVQQYEKSGNKEMAKLLNNALESLVE
ncbi:hypothetical protein FDP41_006379 [Naegleria fowleri]|uniref:ER membrane protein complex subunit 2 n=1 Tax=Naegleria fowleri TaxID=5763 RepID=A0A6A5BAZ8_NAEFO|nr:uncharacterized protein FDP41_006379 [Naegleria fowleri]KAF0974347.1 hypothetical protein FDP41_006379 [Naegleria fowleri]CAG4709172.1 unnamed protein product [Naegleria fowleri]